MPWAGQAPGSVRYSRTCAPPPAVAADILQYLHGCRAAALRTSQDVHYKLFFEVVIARCFGASDATRW
jgi:hypothetical protein